MAGEIAFDYQSNKICYAQIRNRVSGYIWNGASFEVYNSLSGNLSTYPVSVVEQGVASSHFVGNFPTAIPPGTYDVTAKQKIQGFFSENDPTVAGGQVEWKGPLVVPLSDLATSGQVASYGPVRLAKGNQVKNFGFYLRSAADHNTPFVSGLCSGQISRDGGVFGPLQSGAFSETGLGFYTVQALTSGDLNANTAALVFTAVNALGGASDPAPYTIVMQPGS